MKKELEDLRYVVAQTLRTTQFLSQTLLGNLLLGRRPSVEVRAKLPPTKDVLKDLSLLYEQDLQNIHAGIYKMPRDLLPDPISFSKQSFKVFRDLFRVKDREERHAVTEFSDEKVTRAVPKYYAQNFHHQTDGYLSEESANLYDHQVELVFAGGADAMRRQALVPLYYHSQKRAADEVQPLSLLDVACGTGRFMKMVKENFADSLVTGLDLSPWYLKQARENLAQETQVDFVQSNAETIPFKDNSFDAVSCIFMFHELPRRVREIVALEMARVLKPGGILIFVDSIQFGDKPDFDESLRLFPQTYHEPYYLDYAKQDLVELFEGKAGLKVESMNLAFFSKVLTLRKN